MIEKLTKRRVQVETMLWDGTDERAYLIKAWVGWRTILVDGEAVLAGEDRYDPAFVLPAEVTGSVEHALLWVAHNRDWCGLPVGYRVAKELDGSGFYPLSPEGAAAGYEMPGAVEGSTPIASPAPAAEPAPVPPPVDALLKLIGVYGQARFAVGAAEERDSEGQATKWRGRASEAHETITNEVNALWAAGVEEGRRQGVRRLARGTDEWATYIREQAFARGVAEGRRQATEDLTTWLDQLAARLPQYNSELSVCTRRANAQVLGAYERAATIARSGLDRNPRCSTCGDTRGGPRGHETSECTWDMWRWPDLLAVPRDAPATEEITEERCDLPDEHEPHDYDVDAPAGEWRHCDGAAVTEATRG